jgi:hypothetical protein
MIAAGIATSDLDPVAEMKSVNALALQLAALAPQLAAGRNAPTTCPAPIASPRDVDAGGPGGAPILDARELLRFAPPDAGAAFAALPNDTVHMSDRYMKDFNPWERAQNDRNAHLSADVVEKFKGGYVVVIDQLSYEPARIDRALVGDDAFTSGRVHGRAIVFELEHARPLCQTTFDAENSKEVKWRTGDSYAERGVRDNLETNAMRAAWAAVVKIAPALAWAP